MKMELNKHISSVTQPYPTVCDPMGRSMPGFSVGYQLPELTQIHVHGVGDAIKICILLKQDRKISPIDKY